MPYVILHAVARGKDLGHLTGRIQVLINKGLFDLEARNIIGQTPIQSASTFGNTNIIETLFRSGANLFASDNVGRTSLHRAVCCRNISTIILLLEMGLDPNISDNNGWTPLHEAVSWGYQPIAERLIEHKADPLAVDNRGWTTLLAAVKGRNPELVMMFLGLGLKLNHSTITGLCPLTVAVCSGYSEMVTFLLQKGADITATEWDGSTALHNSAFFGHRDITRTLLEYGADPNALSWRFGTPCTLAVECMTGVRDILLSRGGDGALAGRFGRTVIDWYATYGMLKEDMEVLSSSHRLTPNDEIRRKLAITLYTFINNMMSFGQHSKILNELGRILMFLDNEQEARIAFQQSITKSGNFVAHGVTCTSCKITGFKGSRFVCQVCANTDLCLMCFSEHPTFEATVLNQFQKHHTTGNGHKKDPPWVGFLAINNLNDLYYRIGAELETKSPGECGGTLIRWLREL